MIDVDVDMYVYPFRLYWTVFYFVLHRSGLGGLAGLVWFDLIWFCYVSFYMKQRNSKQRVSVVGYFSELEECI